jgi:hypothetical protein
MDSYYFHFRWYSASMMAIIALADPIETEFSTTIQLYLVRYRDTVPHLPKSPAALHRSTAVSFPLR